MKTKFTIALAAAASILAGAAFFTGTPAPRPETAPTVIRTQRPERKAAPAPEDVESVNLSNWQSRFETLQQSAGREDAVRALMAELDAVYGEWVDARIAPLAELPPIDRYDQLNEIEISVREGSAAVLELLGVEGGRHVGVLARPLESVTAEIEYAEAAPDHESRVGLLRLDRERQTRIEQALAITGEPEKTQALGELDAWYDAGLNRIFSAADGMN
ncbi:MAG: hypothetical protein V4584_06225 [Verrucomicrobiota bacterium]